MQLSAKTERFKSNEFIKNTIEEEKVSDEQTYNYYIRPFIPFWQMQQLKFETINAFDEIPNINEKSCPRYVLHDLVRTWISEDPDDKSWFDRADIYDFIKDDLILRIHSKLPTTKILRKFF